MSSCQAEHRQHASGCQSFPFCWNGQRRTEGQGDGPQLCPTEPPEEPFLL